MNPIILEALGGVEIGEPVTFKNLTLFPLVGPSVNNPGYLTLDEALEQGVVEITEVSKAGSVPDLRVVNLGSLGVLLLDGEELVGARQNRVLNLTVLVPPVKTIVIPVSCVEAGRWSFRSEKFAAAPRTHYAAGRARRAEQVTASLRASGERHSDQGAVWADIAAKSARLGVDSETGAMADVFELHAESVDDYVVNLPAPSGAHTGAAFAIGPRLVGFDLFDAPRTLERLLPKIVRSYALDAIENGAKPTPPERAHVSSLLDAVRQARGDSFPAVGEGEDVRLTGERVSGAALVARGRVVHLSAFRMNGEGLRSSGRVRRHHPPLE
jgi:hypothetical protein